MSVYSICVIGIAQSSRSEHDCPAVFLLLLPSQRWEDFCFQFNDTSDV
jgi:hypothetical protein